MRVNKEMLLTTKYTKYTKKTKKTMAFVFATKNAKGRKVFWGLGRSPSFFVNFVFFVAKRF